jgi:ATP-dependent RNA helicase DHX36
LFSRSTTFKTIEDGQVMLNQNSINSKDQQLPYPWLVYNEKVKTSSVMIRDTTGVSDSMLLLFGGQVKV